MELETEEQANKVRAVMGAMITKLQDAREAGDKEATATLKAQYKVLQDALRDYNARVREQAKEAKAEQRDAVQAYKDMANNLKDNIAELKLDLKEANETITQLREQVKELRRMNGHQQHEINRLTDEVRTLRAPTASEQAIYRRAQLTPPPAYSFTREDLMNSIDEITGHKPPQKA